MAGHPAVSDADLARLAALVAERAGLRFSEDRHSELRDRTVRFLDEAHYSSWEPFLAQLRGPAADTIFDRFIETLVVGETYFFRHQAFFDALEREALPELIARRRDARYLRCWSAGCATGEEAYSLAILLSRLVPDPAAWDISILATDLSQRFLAQAAAGEYGERSFRETDETFKSAYFARVGRRYRIRPEFRRLVRFAPLNLAEDTYPSAIRGAASLDVILCRNVLIYFTPDASRRVVQRLHDALAPGGWLVLGPSDPPPGRDLGFEQHLAPDAVLYRRAEPGWDAFELAPLAQETTRMIEGDRQCSPPLLVGVLTPVHGADPVVGGAGLTPGLRATPSPAQLERGTGGEAGPDGAGARSAQGVGTAPGPAPRGSASVPSVDREGTWQELLRAARASADRGDLATAEEQCREAISGAALQPEPYYVLGLVHQARGEDDRALGALRQALYVDRSFAPALLAMAAVYRRAGDGPRARQALERARRLLAGRNPDEVLLVEEQLTVGRLRNALDRALEVARPEKGMSR